MSKQTKFLNSKIVGVLKLNDQLGEALWESELIEIPFFDNRKLRVLFEAEDLDDSEGIELLDRAIGEFLRKSISDRLSLSESVYKNCMDSLNCLGYMERDKSLWDIQNPNEVWNYVVPNEIYVMSASDLEENAHVVIHCECEWELEHGLQLVFEDGKDITRISGIDGHLTDDADNNLATGDKRLTTKLWNWLKRVWS